MVFVAIALAGCAPRYHIETSQGTIVSKGKPRQDRERGVFIYRDLQGLERAIPAGSVRQIAPASDAPSATQFKTPGAK
jgi:hypothetical protein